MCRIFSPHLGRRYWFHRKVIHSFSPPSTTLEDPLSSGLSNWDIHQHSTMICAKNMTAGGKILILVPPQGHPLFLSPLDHVGGSTLLRLVKLGHPPAQHNDLRKEYDSRRKDLLLFVGGRQFLLTFLPFLSWKWWICCSLVFVDKSLFLRQPKPPYHHHGVPCHHHTLRGGHVPPCCRRPIGDDC